MREVELEDVRNAYQGLATEHRRLQANVMQVCQGMLTCNTHCVPHSPETGA